MSTYRERRENKAARLREWAASREHKAEAIANADESIREDMRFVAAQPGIANSSTWKRTMAREEKEWEHRAKASAMQGRAAGIESQLDRAIYSDDPDAIDALKARLEGMEADRERIAAFNAAIRKAKGDKAKIAAALETLPQSDRMGFLYEIERESWRQPERKGFPPYVLSNLAGQIKRTRDRIAFLERERDQGETPRYLAGLRYESECRECGKTLAAGTPARWFKKAREVACYPACS